MAFHRETKHPPYIYDNNSSDAEHVLTAWSFQANQPCTTRVLPDGCRDFIVRESTQGQYDWFISELSTSSYTVSAECGRRMFGLRLQPGVKIDVAGLSRCLENDEPTELLKVDRIDEFCSRSLSLATALECLASVLDIQTAAKELGVSARTLQRLVKAGTGHTPHFWWSLARIRQTARALPEFSSLVDAAGIFGFADQAHMTREMRKWLAASPGQVRADQELLSLLHETGYG